VFTSITPGVCLCTCVTCIATPGVYLSVSLSACLQESVKYPDQCSEEDGDDEVDDGQKDEGEEEEEEKEETEPDAEEGGGAGGEESLTEDEEAIVAYLRDDEPLPSELLQKLLNEWWHQEPFR